MKKKISELAKMLEKDIGKEAHIIEEKIHKALEKLPEENKIKLKEFMYSIGTPTLYEIVLFLMTSGNPSEFAVYSSILAGAIVGGLEASEVSKLEESVKKKKEEKLKEVI